MSSPKKTASSGFTIVIMSGERQRKIELLIRKNEAQKRYPYYLTELSHVLKHPVAETDLVELSLTDDLLAQYNKGACLSDPKSILKAIWPVEPKSRWLRVCFCIAEQLESEKVVLFAGPYSACGAIRTQGDRPLVNAAAVLAFDRDTVRLQSLNSDSGLYLDLYEENSAQMIELKVWGEWCKRVKKCLAES